VSAFLRISSVRRLRTYITRPQFSFDLIKAAEMLTLSGVERRTSSIDPPGFGRSRSDQK
jgi:hypothetical protein